MENAENIITSRIDQLVTKGKALLLGDVKSFQSMQWSNNTELFNEWINNSQSTILMTVDKKSHYYQNFVKVVKSI